MRRLRPTGSKEDHRNCILPGPACRRHSSLETREHGRSAFSEYAGGLPIHYNRGGEDGGIHRSVYPLCAAREYTGRNNPSADDGNDEVSTNVEVCFHPVGTDSQQTRRRTRGSSSGGEDSPGVTRCKPRLRSPGSEERGSFPNGAEWHTDVDDTIVLSTSRCKNISDLPLSKRFQCGTRDASRGRNSTVCHKRIQTLLRNLIGGARIGAGLPKNLASASDLLQYPLHLKKVHRLIWDDAETFILPEYIQAWSWARQCVCDERLLTAASPTQCNVREAFLSDEDIVQLLAFGIIEKCTTTPRNTCNVFSVLELDKNRRRMIIETLLNDFLLYAGEVVFPTLRELQLEIMNSEGAITFDFASFYNHFPIPSQVRDFFTFLHNGVVYQLMVIATGQRQCPAGAQALTASLTKQAIGTERCTGSAYIDNIRFCGSRDVLDRVFIRFVSLCKTLHITINDIDVDEVLIAPFSTCYDYLGVTFDHGNKTTQLTTKTRGKLWNILDELKSPALLTLRDVLRVFGNIVWAARVLSTPLAMTYHLIKFIRRRSSTHQLDQIVDVWISLVPRIERNITFLLFAAPHVIRANAIDRGITLFTDACLSGYGCVLFMEGSVHIVAGNFLQQESINILESRALRYGIGMLPYLQQLTAINIFVDNTSCAGAFKKGRCSNYIMNNLLSSFHSELVAKNFLATIHYVRSALNCADGPSRLFENVVLPSTTRISSWQEYI